MTPEEAEAINRRENGRIGLEVKDHHGRSFWITDIPSEDRFLVTSETGRKCWWNPGTRTASPVKSKQRVDRERAEAAL